MGCGGSKNIPLETLNFLKMLRTQPDFKSFKADQERVRNLTSAWNSSVFGGCVLNPLGGTANGKRTRYNVLDQQLSKAQINTVFGGGYYQLRHVQILDDLYCDIWILVEDVKRNDHIKMIREHEENAKSKDKDASKNQTKLKFDDIKDSLTGWARVIIYADLKEQGNRLESLWEGHFKNGDKDGYVRGLSAVDGSCSVGMHKGDVVDGKFLCFKLNGTCAKPEGFYEGSKLIQELQIQNFF